MDLDILRDTSKPLLKTDKIGKEILNIKYKNRTIISKTISKVQAPKPLETKKIKKIVGPIAPELKIEEIVADDKEEKKEEDE